MITDPKLLSGSVNEKSLILCANDFQFLSELHL